MDNTGVGKSALGEDSGNFEATQVPSGEVDNFEQFLNSREDLKPQMEAPGEMGGEESAETEAQAEKQPTEAAPVEEEKTSEDERRDNEVRAQLSQIDVKRDAGKMPSNYQKAVAEIIHKNQKDPFRLVSELDIARWDFLGKIFGRKRGDGFNGDTK